MKINILVGGKAGQGINKVSEIISEIMSSQGYFTFNYRDYPSLIRGGHNFNIISISEKRVGSYASLLDGILALDNETMEKHKKQLKKDGFIIDFSDKGQEFGRNLNVAIAGALTKVLGIEKKILIKEVKKQLNFPETIEAAEKGFDSEEKKYNLPKRKKKIKLMNGAQGVALGAVNSDIDYYFAYPMTPATSLLHELAGRQKDNDLKVFQAENEISVVNMAIGNIFTGNKVMIGTSGGGYDLMTESLSMVGMAEVPLVLYLASRPGPGTGVPTYNLQGDLNIALRGGHGEFPRVVVAPGDPKEAIEKTNEAFYLSEKFRTLSIVLCDKHLSESQFSFDTKPNKKIKVKMKRNVPGKKIVRFNSYEHDEQGHTTENPEIVKKMADKRLEKYKKIQKEVSKFEMIKLYGNKKAKNLVIGWGSTKGQILDSLPENYQFLQVLYLKPISDEIRKIINRTRKNRGSVVLVEQNLTGQLGRLIRESTGIKIENRILKYDTLPFESDKLNSQLKKLGK